MMFLSISSNIPVSLGNSYYDANIYGTSRVWNLVFFEVGLFGRNHNLMKNLKTNKKTIYIMLSFFR